MLQSFVRYRCPVQIQVLQIRHVLQMSQPGITNSRLFQVQFLKLHSSDVFQTRIGNFCVGKIQPNHILNRANVTDLLITDFFSCEIETDFARRIRSRNLQNSSTSRPDAFNGRHLDCRTRFFFLCRNRSRTQGRDNSSTNQQCPKVPQEGWCVFELHGFPAIDKLSTTDVLSVLADRRPSLNKICDQRSSLSSH